MSDIRNRKIDIGVYIFTLFILGVSIVFGQTQDETFDISIPKTTDDVYSYLETIDASIFNLASEPKNKIEEFKKNETPTEDITEIPDEVLIYGKLEYISHQLEDIQKTCEK